MLIHNGCKEIVTENLLLRRFQCSDNCCMGKYWVSDPEIQHAYAEPVYETSEEINALLKKYISSYKNDDYYRWAITLKGSGECIGQIAYFLMDNKNQFAEIEYCIGRDFQCRGYATEACKAVTDYGFSFINLHKVQICHRESNNASRRVIEKCGFVYEGMLRDHMYLNGKFENRLYYSILRKEWNSL